MQVFEPHLVNHGFYHVNNITVVGVLFLTGDSQFNQGVLS